MMGRCYAWPARLRPFWLVGAASACGHVIHGPPAESMQPSPTLSRVTVLATGSVAGVIEPCGCVKDQLGGLDRFATAVKQSRTGDGLLLTTGSLFFPRVEVPAGELPELVARGKALAKCLAALGAFAWVPGRADTDVDASVVMELAQLANLHPVPSLHQSAGPANSGDCAVQVVRGTRVGVCGYADASAAPATTALSARLTEQLQYLNGQHANLKIALLDMQPGLALRAIERVPGFQLMVLGGPSDLIVEDTVGAEPQLIGNTLVVQPPNHLQGLTRVNFNIRAGQFEFADGTGLGRDAERTQLAARIQELTERLAEWKQQNQNARLLQARAADLERLNARVAELSKPLAVPKGSYFTVAALAVGTQFAGDPSVHNSLNALGRSINDSNRVKFASRKAPPAAPGQATYVGVGECERCHEEPAKVWRSTRHSHAYQSLVNAEREFTLECVGCHVTGYEQPGGSSVTDVAGLKNVQCENCHGPGSIHAATSKKEDIQRKPDRNLCARRCHHSPHEAANWSFEAALPKILGKGHGQ